MNSTVELGPRARLALDVILGKPVTGIPSWLINVMEHAFLDRLAGEPVGSYVREPERVYLAAQKNIGVCMIDQFIPMNPLEIEATGYRGAQKGATTGASQVALDGMAIDSPEAVVEHLEQFEWPRLDAAIATFSEDTTVETMLALERQVQAQIGPDILKVPYGCAAFPGFRYSAYGYEQYFMAYGLYPEVMEKDFALQAEWAVLYNRAAARAYHQGHLPPLCRLDHDMAGSQGVLVNIRSLDAIWFPYLAQALEPLLKSDVKLIWHCDGNLMEMVPRLLEVGLHGFQGFQYESGMDYERICRMRTRAGEELFIIAGVSVTRALPYGTPDDIRRQLRWLVDKGPKKGLFLGCSSSMAPGVPWENVQTLAEGVQYYQVHGRG